ncbi:MAG: zinc-finger domain-containing protein [Alphaproteobacteria bacterium]|nr:zinc-finger domain-containing protein [Alphaproteobacteria bacterium]
MSFLLLPFFAMADPIETVSVDTPKVACIGDTDSPHPKVYLSMGARRSVDCPYCSRRFVLDEKR